MSSVATACPKCGAPITAGASEGLCPRCLVAGVLSRQTVLPPDEGEVDTTVTRAEFPRRFGDYELLAQIARGGMGVVYRARNVGMNRVVALKMLREGRLAGPAAVRRFLIEAEAAGRLDHPNIVPVYEVGEHNGRHFFTMRFVEGGSLAAKCGERGGKDEPGLRLSTRTSVRLLLKVARAVHFAHEHGILHRDLKPANILLDAQGEPLVSDFGLAKLTESESSSGLTLNGTVIGTPAYMAPEQAAGTTAEQTTAADTYSLGAILYQLLAGRPPFAGATPIEIARKAIDEEPLPPSRFARDQTAGRVNRKSQIGSPIDRDLDTICLKCLEKDPARRYASAAALADDLERWLRHEPIAARQTPTWEKAAKWSRRRPARALLVAVTVVSAVAFIGLRLDSEAKLKCERDQVILSERRARAAAALAGEEARRAEKNELATRLNLYASDIYLAQRALDEGNLGLARRTLAAHAPAAGQPDLRGYEWRFLWNLSRGDEARVVPAHTKPVTALAFSRDGRTLASGGRDGRVRFWNTSDGSPGMEFPASGSSERRDDLATVTALLAVSPEALALVASGSEQFAGISMRVRSGALGEVRRIALSPDGQWLATGSEGSYVRVWSVTNQQIRFVIPLPDPRALAFTADSRRLVLGESTAPGKEGEAAVRIYDVFSHQRLQTLEQVTGHFALSDDGRALAVARKGSGLEIREVESGTILRRWPTDDSLHDLAWSPDGRVLAAVGSSRREIHLWSAEGERLGRFAVAGERVWAIAFSPDSRTLATAGADHSVRLWDLARQTERRSLRGHGDEVLAVAFAPSGDRVASAGKDMTVRLWPISDSADEGEWQQARHAVAVARDGRGVATRSPDGQVQICDTVSRRTFALPSGAPRDVLGFLANGSSLVTLERPDTKQPPQLRHWNSSGERVGEPVAVAETPEGKISTTACAIAADLGALASGKGNVIVFDLKTGRAVHRLNWARREVTWLSLSPDGQWLAAVSWPNRARIWNLAKDQVVADWAASEGVVQRLAFSPDGLLLATAGDDNMISVWEAATGARAALLRGHKAEVTALAFTPDGRTLGSASADRTLKLWHVPTWRELGTLRRERLFTFLAFAGDGPSLFVGEYRKSLHILRAPPEATAAVVLDEAAHR